MSITTRRYVARWITNTIDRGLDVEFDPYKDVVFGSSSHRTFSAAKKAALAHEGGYGFASVDVYDRLPEGYEIRVEDEFGKRVMTARRGSRPLDLHAAPAIGVPVNGIEFRLVKVASAGREADAHRVFCFVSVSDPLFTINVTPNSREASK